MTLNNVEDIEDNNTNKTSKTDSRPAKVIKYNADKNQSLVPTTRSNPGNTASSSGPSRGAITRANNNPSDSGSRFRERAQDMNRARSRSPLRRASEIGYINPRPNLGSTTQRLTLDIDWRGELTKQGFTSLDALYLERLISESTQGCMEYTEGLRRPGVPSTSVQIPDLCNPFESDDALMYDFADASRALARRIRSFYIYNPQITQVTLGDLHIKQGSLIATM